MRVSGLLKLAGKYPKGLTAYRHIGGIHGKRNPHCSSIEAFSAQKCPTKQPCGAQRRLTCYSALPSARRCLKERHSSGFDKQEVSSETRMLEEKTEANEPQDLFLLCVAPIRLICFICLHSWGRTSREEPALLISESSATTQQHWIWADSLTPGIWGSQY